MNHFSFHVPIKAKTITYKLNIYRHYSAVEPKQTNRNIQIFGLKNVQLLQIHTRHKSVWGSQSTVGLVYSIYLHLQKQPLQTLQKMSRKLKMEGGYFKFCKEPISVLDNFLFAMSATDYWVGMMAFYPKCECARVTHHS